MEQQIKDLIDKAKKDQQFLRKLKYFATDNSQYQLAKQLRDIELTNFPETKAIQKDKEDAKSLSGCLRMCGLGVSDQHAYIIIKCMAIWNKKKGKFAMDDSSKIEYESEQLFL